MHSRLFDYVDKNKYIRPFQHGFQLGHFLLNLQDNISAANERNE